MVNWKVLRLDSQTKATELESTKVSTMEYSSGMRLGKEKGQKKDHQ